MVEAHIEHLIDERFRLNKKQRQAALERERDVVVTAGAGSGKTLTLVARYTTLLAEGISPRRIAAITFSIKAAREMRSRVRTKLLELQTNETDPAQREKWLALSAQMDSARIGTIHSLCAEILRAHPAEAGIDPKFEVVDESLSAALRQQAVEDTLKWLAENDQFAPLLYNITVRDLTSMLGDLLNKRLEAVEAFKISVDQEALAARILQKQMSHQSIVKNIEDLQDIHDNATHYEKDLVLLVNELLQLWKKGKSYLEEGCVIDCASALYEIRRKHLNLNNWRKFSEEKLIAKELQINFDALINPLTGGKDAKDPLPTPEKEALSSQLLPLLKESFKNVCQAYQESLDARSALDFDDLEGRALELLKREDIRTHWQAELDAVLVDEFQDTNQRQREIIEALTGTPGKLFIVGDMRQSIYRFRGADVTVFSEVQERIRQEGGFLRDLDLTYRAHQPLLNAMGDLLAGVIGTKLDRAKPYYVPYTPMIAEKERPDEGIQAPHVEFILGAGEDAEQAYPIAARALAQRLIELKNAGQITKWDDVALLFRASTGYPEYEDALQDAGIPYVTVAGRGFYDRPEIRDLLNILHMLADPQDNLAFAGLLRSPAFGLSDAALYLLRQENQDYNQTLRGDLSDLDEVDRTRAERAKHILDTLLPWVDKIPVAELIKYAVDALDYRAILATADAPLGGANTATTGGRLYRNLDKLLEDALVSQQVTLRNYLEMINTLNDAGAREGEASAEAEGAVSLMTIHKAKGLEFNVVVLAAAGRRPRNSGELAYLNQDLGVTLKLDPPPMLYNLSKQLDKDQEDMEALRVLYVALTRAKQKLIISGHATIGKKGDLSLSAWTKDLAEAAGLESILFIQKDSQPFESQTASGEPFYAWCALEDSFTLHHDEMEVEQAIPKKPERIPLYQPVAEEISTLAEMEETIGPNSWRATIKQTAIQGKRVGSLVHKAIQRWTFPGNPQLQTLLETEAINLGIVSDNDREELIQKAVKLLARLKADPIWEKIDNALRRYHELPYTHHYNGNLHTRKIDLLYQDDAGWHIIDFKTDPINSLTEKESLVSEYSKQVRAYKGAVWQLLHIETDARICFLDDQGMIDLVEI